MIRIERPSALITTNFKAALLNSLPGHVVAAFARRSQAAVPEETSIAMVLDHVMGDGRHHGQATRFVPLA
ncbi:hypothetical protein [Nitrobacter sp. Nb-311A]|uniref:hypothetical protein n=1 Tax=Nitrobacter sp. Nb-311A TaxID=314253 RepID=UPI000305B982|nr:hypothetical protein [Nitrobacter sp. Nb-311A]